MSVNITRDPATRAWVRWAGHGNGPAGEMLDVAMAVIDVVGIWTAASRGYDPVSVTGRVRHVRRGGTDTTPGAWREAGQPLIPVSVLLDGRDRYIDGHRERRAITMPLSAVTPLGTLNLPRRPRATAPNGTELQAGVVVRAGDRVASLLMLRKADVALLAVLQGWPSPHDLPHGQNPDEIIDATT